MDIGVSAVTTTYTPMQAYSQQGMVATVAQSNPTTNAANSQQTLASLPAASQPDPQSQSSATDLQSTTGKQAKSTVAQNASSTASVVANFSFVVDQQNHRIMKLSDGNGVLIYQIPSKGQLALISAQENEQKRIALVA